MGYVAGDASSRNSVDLEAIVQLNIQTLSWIASASTRLRSFPTSLSSKVTSQLPVTPSEVNQCPTWCNISVVTLRAIHLNLTFTHAFRHSNHYSVWRQTCKSGQKHPFPVKVVNLKAIQFPSSMIAFNEFMLISLDVFLPWMGSHISLSQIH